MPGVPGSPLQEGEGYLPFRDHPGQSDMPAAAHSSVELRTVQARSAPYGAVGEMGHVFLMVPEPGRLRSGCQRAEGLPGP